MLIISGIRCAGGVGCACQEVEKESAGIDLRVSVRPYVKTSRICRTWAARSDFITMPIQRTADKYRQR